MSGLHCTIKLRAPKVTTGLDGGSVAGLSVLSGHVLSAPQIARSDAGILALAGKLARQAGTKGAPGEMPVAAKDELSERATFLDSLLARVLSWIPSIVLPSILQATGVARAIAILDNLLPPAPSRLAGNPVVTVQENIALDLRSAAPECLTVAGRVIVRMVVRRLETAVALRRHLRNLPSKTVASAGYLLFGGTLRLRWQTPRESSRIGRPIGKYVLALEDLASDPRFATLKNPLPAQQEHQTDSIPIDTELHYELPELSKDLSMFRKVFILAARIPGENEIRRLDFTITLRPEIGKLGLSVLYPAEFNVSLPSNYPPVQSAILEVGTKAGRKAVDANITVPTNGSGVDVSVRQQSGKSEEIQVKPGESMLLSLTFRPDGNGVVGLGGEALLHVGFGYQSSLGGADSYMLLSRSGRVAANPQWIGSRLDSLRLDITSTVDLQELQFPTIRRESFLAPAGLASGTDMTFVRRLIDKLAEEHVLVRQAMERQSASYGGKHKTGATWDLYARYERSMAGPDVHIALHTDPDSVAAVPSAVFDVTVLGQTVFDDKLDLVHEVSEIVRTVLRELCVGEGRQVEGGSSFSARGDSTAQITSTVVSGQAPCLAILEGFTQRWERLLNRFERLSEDSPQMVGKHD